jgi:hypothetical protein
MDLRVQIVTCNNPAKLPVNAETINEMMRVIWELQSQMSGQAEEVSRLRIDNARLRDEAFFIRKAIERDMETAGRADAEDAAARRS